MATKTIRATVAAALAIAASAIFPSFAATNITENVTLTEDTDWTEFGTVTLAAGATVNLNGHSLTVKNIDGAGAIADIPGYQRLEYIEATGNQYIDTEDQHNASTIVDIRIQFTSVSINYQSFYATYAPDPNGEFRIDAAGYTLVLTGGDYGAFAGWAKRHPEVLDGSRSVSAKSARVSSALDLDGLVPDETLDALRQSGVRITRAAFTGGVVEITLKVDDLPVGEAAQMEHVKRIFGIIGSQGGEAPFLADEVVQVSEPVRAEDGAVRFRVCPAVSPAPKRFFFRGKIDLTTGNTLSHP